MLRAVSPVKTCQRRMIVSTYNGSNSNPKHLRPTRSAAINVVPLPKNGSSTTSPRAEQSRSASATSCTGFTVGCSASRLPSSPLRPNEFTPG